MKHNVPIHEKYLLSIEEASQYFHIGENKLRKIAKEHKNANWLFYNGQRLLVKREAFEKVLDKLTTI